MWVLRWVYLLACVCCVLLVARNAHWEGRLTGEGVTWLVHERAPYWSPPPIPYERFRQDFGREPGFPAADAAAVQRIERVLLLEWMAVDLLVYLWPLSVAAGLLYLLLRGDQRDRVLHLALWGALGLTAGAAMSLGLWLTFGGWGPPYSLQFGGVGFLGGLSVGAMTFRREKRAAEAFEEGSPS